MKFLRGLSLSALILCFAACTEDEPALGNYRQDLTEVFTDATGEAVRLVTDNGETFTVNNGEAIGRLRPDTVYRALALYLPAAGHAEISSLSAVVSSLPASFDNTPVLTNPVRVKAVWRGGRYANLLVSVRTSNQSHKFAFVDRGITQEADGHMLQTIELHHDSNGDGTYYERQIYLSCPLYCFEGKLHAGRDSVELRINTDNGPYVKRLPF